MGLAFPGDSRALDEFSGIPAGLAGGLEAHGVDLVRLRADVPARLRRPAYAAAGVVRRAGARVATVQTVALRAALVRAGRLDGVVQLGTGYEAHTRAPVVTLDDMTVPQAVEHSDWRPSPAVLERRLAVQRRAYQRARARAFATDWAAASAVREYALPVETVHAVGFGRNLDLAPPPARDWSTPRFLFVAKGWEAKGGPAVVRAFARVRERTPNAALHLAGWHPRVDVPGVVGHGAIRLDVPEERAALERLYCEATCFVMPSRFDAAGIVFAEAAAAGLPSIGGTVGGSRFMIGDGGVVVDPEDGDALLAAMLTLADAREAEATGARALARAPLFTWSAVAGRLLAALGLTGGAEPCL